MASKEDLKKLEGEMIELRERVTKCEIDILALKEILANTKPSGNSS